MFNDYNIAQNEYPEFVHAIEESKKEWDKVPKTGKAVVVNVPAAQVWLFNNGELQETIKAIIGKPNHKTPSMKDTIKYLELNPKWYVPNSIAKRDLVPKMQQRPEMIKKYDFRFYDRNWQPVKPEAIDFSNVSNWNHYIVQNPGWSNSMGEIKFMFPNKDNIYLHDTPDKTLFRLKQNKRTISSGCVRIEEPFLLAKFLVDRSVWRQAQQRNPEDIIKLEKPIPINITYMPIWVDEDLDVNFGYDVYGKFRKGELPDKFLMEKK